MKKDRIEFAKPDDGQLEQWLGESGFAVWRRLRRRIEERYGLAPEWGPGGKKWLCECKYRRGWKTLCALYARERTFGLMVIFGGIERDRFEAERHGFPESIQAAYDAAATYHDGKWVMFETPEEDGVDALIRLLRIKRKPAAAGEPPVIRPATEADIPAIARIIADNFDQAMPEHSPAVRKKFKAHSSPETLTSQLKWKQVFVICRNAAVIGTGALANFGTPEQPKWSISNFFIAVEHHGEGCGDKLLNDLIAAIRTQGVTELHVPSSRTAVAFYRRSGFREDAAQPPEDVADEITWMTLSMA